MRLASQGDHYSMPRLLVVLSALAQLHSTVAFALVTRPTLPLAKAKSVRMAESSSDSGLEFFQAGVLPTVAAQLGCTALLVAATIDPGPLHDFALLWQPLKFVDGSQVAQWALLSDPGFWLRWGLWLGCRFYFDFYYKLEVITPATDTATDTDVSSATEVQQVDNGPSKSLRLGAFTFVQSWGYAVVVSWFITNIPADLPADFLSNVFGLATDYTELLLLGLAAYALIIGPEFPAASRLAMDKKSAASRLSSAALYLFLGLGQCFVWATSAGMLELGKFFLGGLGLVIFSVPFISSAQLWFEILVVRDEASTSADMAAARLYEKMMSLFFATAFMAELFQRLCFLLAQP